MYFNLETSFIKKHQGPPLNCSSMPSHLLLALAPPVAGVLLGVVIFVAVRLLWQLKLLLLQSLLGLEPLLLL